MDAALNAYGSARTVGQSGDARINAMAAANAAYDTYQAVGAVANAAAGQAASVSITVGSQQSSNEMTAQSREVVGSAVRAGGQVAIEASGAGEDSNIRISGSEVYGGTGTRLSAENAIDIVAAQNTHEQQTENSSSGWNAGVGISFGSGGWAAGITAGANAGEGHSDGETVIHTHSHVGSGDTTVLESGGTTTIAGGQVTGERVEVTAADLVIESVQDTETYESEQMNASGQVTVGYGVSVSGSYSQSDVEASYASVTEQSGILAGDGGYAVNVTGNTNLVGGIATSTQAAEDAGNNSFVTGTLTASDIENHAEYDGTAFGVSGSVGRNASGEQGEHSLAQGAADGTPGGTSASKSIGFGSDSDQQSSATTSGINTANLVITDVEGQTATGATVEQITADIATDVTSETVAANSGALDNRFDADTVQRELDVQVAVTQGFDRTQQGVRREINSAIDEATQLKEDVTEVLRENPDLNHEERAHLLALALDAQNEIERLQKVGVLVSAVAGGLSSPTSSAGGMIASTLAPAVSYEIGQHFKENAIRNVIDAGDRSEEGSASHLLAHALLGAAVAAVGGNDALIAGIAAAGAEAAAPALASLLYGKQSGDLDADEKATISAIVSLGGAGLGAVGGEVADIIAANAAAQNAVDNNWGEVGHYSTMATVLYLAGFSEQDAKAVALAAWAPDTDDRNAITFANVYSALDSDSAQQHIHLLDGETDSEKVLEIQQSLGRAVTSILSEIKRNENNPAAKAAILSDLEVQRILHAFGDSYAHVRSDGTHYPPRWGHAGDGTDPDNPYINQDAYLNYAKSIYDIASSVSGNARVGVDSVSDITRRVTMESAEELQRSILVDAIEAAGGSESGRMTVTPVPGCEIYNNCAQHDAGFRTIGVIYNIYEINLGIRYPRWDGRSRGQEINLCDYVECRNNSPMIYSPVDE